MLLYQDLLTGMNKDYHLFFHQVFELPMPFLVAESERTVKLIRRSEENIGSWESRPHN